MKVAVWDTYVTKKNGDIMHFDIIVPDHITDESVIYQMGNEFLLLKGQEGQSLTAKECRLCHIEKASEEMESTILKKGYDIIEMDGCA